MRLSILYFFIQYIILYYKFNFINASPITGIYVSDARQSAYTYVASIKRMNTANPEPEKDHICTGILISRKDILTSEHCLINEDHTSLEIILGSMDLRIGFKFYIFWWITYDQWVALKKLPKQYETNDVAIIRLLQEVPGNIDAAVLAPIRDMSGLHAVMSGWSNTDNPLMARFLKSAAVMILRNEDCESRIEKVSGEKVEILSNIVCSAASPYSVLNKGDSGGPVLYNNRIIAINRGFCPNLPETAYHDQVNIHHTIEYYIIFIRDVIHNYS